MGMTTHYIINGEEVFIEEYQGLNKLYRKAHELIDLHQVRTIEVMTENDLYTITKPCTK